MLQQCYDTDFKMKIFRNIYEIMEIGRMFPFRFYVPFLNKVFSKLSQIIFIVKKQEKTRFMPIVVKQGQNIDIKDVFVSTQRINAATTEWISVTAADLCDYERR